jgi:hypothetical protein
MTQVFIQGFELVEAFKNILKIVEIEKIWSN